MSSEAPALRRRVLIVDADADAARTMEAGLRGAGFVTHWAANGRDGLRAAAAVPPDLVVLETVLPDVPGTEVCRSLKAEPATRTVPVLIASARADEIDRVVAFEIGADDFLAKPVSTRELVLRVQARLRESRVPASVPARSRLGRIEVDTEAHRVFVDGRELHLTPTEFRLLSILYQRRGRAQSRDTLLDEVWHGRAPHGSRTVDTHVRRLREKLGGAGIYVHTVRGTGYRFASHESDVQHDGAPVS